MNEEQLQLPALPARWVDSGRIISENFHHLSARGTVCLVRAGRRNFRVPVTAVTASVEKNRSINMPGGGFRWNVNYGQHTIFGLKGCSMIRRSTWRPQCPPLGGPGPARSARARRMRWRRWRHRNKETAAAAALPFGLSAGASIGVSPLSYFVRFCSILHDFVRFCTILYYFVRFF